MTSTYNGSVQHIMAMVGTLVMATNNGTMAGTLVMAPKSVTF